MRTEEEVQTLRQGYDAVKFRSFGFDCDWWRALSPENANIFCVSIYLLEEDGPACLVLLKSIRIGRPVESQMHICGVVCMQGLGLISACMWAQRKTFLTRLHQLANCAGQWSHPCDFVMHRKWPRSPQSGRLLTHPGTATVSNIQLFCTGAQTWLSTGIAKWSEVFTSEEES